MKKIFTLMLISLVCWGMMTGVYAEDMSIYTLKDKDDVTVCTITLPEHYDYFLPSVVYDANYNPTREIDFKHVRICADDYHAFPTIFVYISKAEDDADNYAYSMEREGLMDMVDDKEGPEYGISEYEEGIEDATAFWIKAKFYAIYQYVDMVYYFASVNTDKHHVHIQCAFADDDESKFTDDDFRNLLNNIKFTEFVEPLKIINESAADGKEGIMSTDTLIGIKEDYMDFASWSERDLCGDLAMITQDLDNDMKLETLVVSYFSKDGDSNMQLTIGENGSPKCTMVYDLGEFVYTGQDGFLFSSYQSNVYISHKGEHRYIVIDITSMMNDDYGLLEIYEYDGNNIVFVDGFSYLDTGWGNCYVYRYLEEKHNYSAYDFQSERQYDTIDCFEDYTGETYLSSAEREGFYSDFAQAVEEYGIDVSHDLRHTVNFPDDNYENYNLLPIETISGEDITFVSSLQLKLDMLGELPAELRRIDYTGLHN